MAGAPCFAISRTGERVYRLHWGSQVGPTYDVSQDGYGCDILPNGFRGFLEYVEAELTKALA